MKSRTVSGKLGVGDRNAFSLKSDKIILEIEINKKYNHLGFYI